MSSLNKVMLIGRLGADPDARKTEGGVPFVRFSLATSAGDQKPDWHSVVAFGKQAEACEAYLSKGQACYVEGRLSYYKQERGDQVRYHTDIVATQVRFLSPPKKGAPTHPSPDLIPHEAASDMSEAHIPF
jgi:single-strand DNA-binding protein